MKAESWFVFIAAGVGILVGLKWLERHTQKAGAYTPNSALNWSTFSNQHIANLPGPQSTWSLL